MHSQAYWPAPGRREAPRPATDSRGKVRNTTGSKTFAQIVNDLGIGTKVEVQEIRHGRTCQVVSRRPESTSHDDQVGLGQSRRKCGLNRLDVIPYDPPPNDGRTEGRQLSAQPGPVRVCRLTGEEFLTNGDYRGLNPVRFGTQGSIPEAQEGTVGP